MSIYFPNKTSVKCFLSESQANQFIQKEGGGSLITVPAFESKHEAEEWIQNRDEPNFWYVSYFSNLISVDNDGNPLQQQTTRRNPGEPISRVRKLEKPEYIYCVEPN